MSLQQVVTGLMAACGVPVACSALYLLTLAVASAFHRPRAPQSAPGTPLLVLVPAHNEAELITGCIASLSDQSYPHELYRVVVVADNCDDQTAVVARSAGADVMVRDEPNARGKGHALRWAMDHIFAYGTPPEAIVVIDADAIVEPAFLRELESEFVAGSDIVQGNDLVLVESGSPRSALEAAALLLRNGVRFAGRAVLGMPASLCGNGMLLSRRVLQRQPWSAFTSAEDSEYSLTLRMAGVRMTFAQRARVYAAATSSEVGAYTQGVRWEAGRYYLMRLWLRRLLSAVFIRRRWDLLTEVIDMAVPPLGVLTVMALVGLGVVLVLMLVHVVSPVAVVPWVIATLVLPTYVVVGLAAAQAPSSFYRALLVMAPVFVVRKLRIYLRLLRRFEMSEWIRTARPAESQGREANHL